MIFTKLVEQIKHKRSFLCVGLDPVIEKIPRHLLAGNDPVFEFCKGIIDATREYAVSYKPNIAFFEALGPDGLDTLMRLSQYLPPDTFNIIDAKRGDMGNTAQAYARAYLDLYGFDAITLNPYQGFDSLQPYLEYPDKVLIVLAKTSNPGSADFQDLKFGADGHPLFSVVVEKLIARIGPERLMFVVGANQHGAMKTIREAAPDYFLLTPGLGAQGATLRDIRPYLLPGKAGLLANYSRVINYAAADHSFGIAAGEQAANIQAEMATML